MEPVKPKIALVHDFLFTFGGAERVLLAFHELYPEAPIYTLFTKGDVAKKHFSKAKIITSPLQKSVLKRWPQLLLGKMPQAIESFDFTGYDIVLSSSGAFSHGVITAPETIHISYCHTPMRYAWDYTHEYLREMDIHGLPLLFLQGLLSRLRVWDFVSSKRVDQFLANSGVVASRIQKFYRRDAAVIYPPINTEYFDREKVTDSQTKDYMVTASRLTANKRIDIMIKACAESKIPLKIIGGGSKRAELETLAKGANIEFLGQVSEEKKREVITKARAFLFAAEDDFGIAPVEALSLGVPVLSLQKGGIQEVIKEGENGYFFQEPTVPELKTALQKFQEKPLTDSEKIRKSALPYELDRFRKEIDQIVSNANQD